MLADGARAGDGEIEDRNGTRACDAEGLTSATGTSATGSPADHERDWRSEVRPEDDETVTSMEGLDVRAKRGPHGMERGGEDMGRITGRDMLGAEDLRRETRGTESKGGISTDSATGTEHELASTEPRSEALHDGQDIRGSGPRTDTSV